MRTPNPTTTKRTIDAPGFEPGNSSDNIKTVYIVETEHAIYRANNLTCVLRLWTVEWDCGDKSEVINVSRCG